jgi:hypothetical protein
MPSIGHIIADQTTITQQFNGKRKASNGQPTGGTIVSAGRSRSGWEASSLGTFTLINDMETD